MHFLSKRVSIVSIYGFTEENSQTNAMKSNGTFIYGTFIFKGNAAEQSQPSDPKNNKSSTDELKISPEISDNTKLSNQIETYLRKSNTTFLGTKVTVQVDIDTKTIKIYDGEHCWGINTKDYCTITCQRDKTPKDFLKALRKRQFSKISDFPNWVNKKKGYTIKMGEEYNEKIGGGSLFTNEGG